MVDDKGMLKTELTYDGLHPNNAGYELIEPIAQKAIDAGSSSYFRAYRRTVYVYAHFDFAREELPW